MRLSVTGSTDVGLKRSHNEDAFLLLPEEHLYCVADGMGGHACGEVASRIAVEEMAEFYQLTGRDEEATWPFKEDRSRSYEENRLLTGVRLANLRIYERAQSDERLKGMGTTLVSLHVTRTGQALIGHVGDSRAYLYRQGALSQLTQDHSLLNDYIRAKRLSPEEIQAFPHKNVIVRALGMKETVQVDVYNESPRMGDVYLLCSDGLSGMIDDPKIHDLVKHEPDLDKATEKLIGAANAAGGVDNITVVMARLEPL
jgi:protein phosphatase